MTGIALAFAGGAALAWLCLRADTRAVRRGTVYRVPALARPARLGWLDPGRFDDTPDRDWSPDPVWAGLLAEWDTAVDGMDWYHPWGQPADIRSEVDDQGATIHRIATRARVGEALERACRRISTDELEPLVP